MSLALGTSFARLNAGSASVKRMFRGSAGVWNADAADWIKRVEANSGSVSTATANAVTNFCNAIDAAGIRDKFYRLNLFCGDSDASLAAVRTPLYRGPSLSGTQYGNAVDTNNNFVPGNYAETGSSGGLLGASTKYLQTGLMPSAMPSLAAGHLSYWRGELVEEGIFTRIVIGSRSATDLLRADERSSGEFGYWGEFVSASSGVANTSGHKVVSRTSSTSLAVYRDGVSVSTDSRSVSVSDTEQEFYVFTGNESGTPSASYVNFLLRSYSIGDALSATHVAALYAAQNTFMQELGRE